MDELSSSRSASVPSQALSQPLSHLGGARADFVAALGRRVAELVTLVTELEKRPGSAPVRDDVRRRIHALAAGARLLRFGRLAEQLCEGEARLIIAADRGVSEEDIASLRMLFDQVPQLAWSDAGDGEPSGARSSGRPKTASGLGLLGTVRMPIAPSAPAPVPAAPLTALVVGAEHLAAALAHDPGGVPFEIERTEDALAAIDLARALAPDVVLLDAARVGARELCEALVSDPLTEAIAVVVVGDWNKARDAAPFLALGVTRTLAKPFSPTQLREACIDAAAVDGRGCVRHAPFGELTVDDLGARLAEELRRGLGDAALAKGQKVRFDLGDGTDVLAALWGAVARIRDVVTIESEGAVRFAPTGPEGALPIAPWLGADGGRRGVSFGESREPGPALDQKVVLVVDDDPAVTWFLAGVLRAEGAIVHEAHDGSRGLEAAQRFTPDVVISDIVMPTLDGFALCRALKRDVVLRDVPVILLSWKEDLLQRVRELGAGADGYLRKEASAPILLQRVREVIRPRDRVKARIGADGEVRGRLDGLTTRTLLALACAARPDATVTVRDTAFLYEVDLRRGRPARATRTSVEGAFERGAKVLGALLGVAAGRFAIAQPTSDAISVELCGSLDEQLLPHLAAARGAARLLTGAPLMSVERVDLDQDRMGGYAFATPEPAKSFLRTIAAGASPRALIASGQAPARLLEDVLADVAARGAVVGVYNASGENVLAAATAHATDVLRGARARSDVAIPELDLGPIIYTSTPLPVEVAAALSVAPPVAEPTLTPRSAAPVAAVVAPAPSVAPPPAIATASVAEHALPPPLSLGSLVPPPVLPIPAPPPRAKAVAAAETAIVLPPAEETPSRTTRRPSSFATSAAPEPEPKPQTTPARDPAAPNRSMWALFAVAGIVFAIGARLSRERELARAAAPVAPAIVETATVMEPPAPAAAAPATAPELPLRPGETKTDPALPQDAPLRAEDRVPPGQGMLEVVAGTSDTIWIDGALVGNGPTIKRALAPRKEPYEIRVKLRGEDRVRFALVKESRLTRVRIAPPWSR